MARFSFRGSEQSKHHFVMRATANDGRHVVSHSLTRSARLPLSLLTYYETLFIKSKSIIVCCVTRFPDCYAIGLLVPPPPPRSRRQVQGCAEDTLLPMIKCDVVLTKPAALLPIFWAVSDYIAPGMHTCRMKPK